MQSMFWEWAQLCHWRFDYQEELSLDLSQQLLIPSWGHVVSGVVASTVTSQVVGLDPPAGAFLCRVYMFSVSVWVLSKHMQVWLTENSDMPGINLHVNDYLSMY